MYRKNICCVDLPPYPKDELGNFIDMRVVDQYPSQDFMIGENGFPRSDIAQMMHTESEELRVALAARMTEIKAQYPDQNLTDEQLIKLTVPRYVQSQHEFREWASRIDELGFNKSIQEFVDSRQKDAVNPDVIKFDNSESEVKVE